MDTAKLKHYLLGEFSVKRLIQSFLFIYGAVMIYALAWSDHMIFPVPASSYRDTADIIKLRTDDGKTISAIYLANSNAAYTVLYSHGNAEDIGQLQPYLKDYCRRGFSILAYDYHGYGTSEGRPTSGNTYRDIEAAYRYLAETVHVPANRIIAHGRSVGGGPTMELACRHELGGVILESSFVTAFRVLTHVPLVPFDKFRNIAKLDRINCPLLVMHGTNDRTIPFWHGERLFEKAKQPKMNCWIENASHDDVCYVAEDRYWQAITDFAATLPAAGKAEP